MKWLHSHDQCTVEAEFEHTSISSKRNTVYLQNQSRSPVIGDIRAETRRPPAVNFMEDIKTFFEG